MDVFYYWQKIDQDIKAERIGWFRSDKDKLTELKGRHPNYLWVFKTPQGRKGNLQLRARLVWTDLPCSSGAKLRPTGESNIFYDPTDAKSLWYTESDTDSAIAEITEWTKRHVNVAVRSNFQGENGQHPLDHFTCVELEKIAAKYAPVPFLQGIEA